MSSIVSEDVYERIMDEVVAAVRSDPLRLAGADVPTDRRKLPTAGESLDTLPLTCVVPGNGAVKDEPWSTGKDGGPERLREYLVSVVLVVAGGKDPRQYLPEYLKWRARIANRFGRPRPLPTVTELWTVQIEPGLVIDPAAYAKGYDYTGYGLRCRCIEVVER